MYLNHSHFLNLNHDKLMKALPVTFEYDNLMKIKKIIRRYMSCFEITKIGYM